MDFIEFWTICSSNNIVLDKEQVWQFERFHREFLHWNSKINLISRKDEQNLLERHILHSLSLIKYYEIPSKARLLDVGTGGGFPGLPLTIARPDIYSLLIDSTKKKITMVDMFAKHTGIKSIQTLAARTEDLQSSGKYAKYFDIVVSRAVAKIPSIISWVNKMIKPNGLIVLWKGGDIEEELESAKKQFKNVNFEVISINLIGADYFTKDNKKLVFCKF